MKGSSRGYLLLLVASFVVEVTFAGTVFLNGPELQASDLRRIDSYVSQALPIYPKGFQLYNAGTGTRPIIVKQITNENRKPGSEHPNVGYYTSLPAIIPQGLEGVATSTFLLGAPIQQQQQQILNEPIVEDNNDLARSGQLIQQSVPDNGASGYKTNPVVVETSKFESNLPAELRNPFYSNQQTASSLAQQSLPTNGEEVVDKWNTNKIQEGKVRDLLTKAGLI